MIEIERELNEEIRGIELALTPPEQLVEEIDRLIQDEVLPESYLHQLSAAITRGSDNYYDIRTGYGKLESDPHVTTMIQLSYLLFASRVLSYALFERLRNIEEKKMAKKIHLHVQDLERFSQAFDNSYREQLGTTHSPALSGAFWENRAAHPVRETIKLLDSAYL